MIDNAEWLVELRAVEFMRDVGKHFTVNYMLQKDSVKGRMDAGISYTEFSYMLLQAYDFLRAAPASRRPLQMGGSDQWGNITAGIELIRRTLGARRARDHVAARHDVGGHEVREDGSGRGVARRDADVAVQVLSVPRQRRRPRRRPLPALLHAAVAASEIEALETRVAEHPEKREAQQALARDVTRLVHGAANDGDRRRGNGHPVQEHGVA